MLFIAEPKVTVLSINIYEIGILSYIDDMGQEVIRRKDRAFYDSFSSE